MAVREIASVVADVKKRVARPVGQRDVYEVAIGQVRDPVVVDVGFVFQSAMDQHGKPYNYYDDHPNIAPPWPEAAFCYVNTYGNVFVMHATSTEIAPRDRIPLWLSDAGTHEVDWQRVRWTIDTFIWMGGRSSTTNRYVATTGPMHLWRFAVYDDGAPADLHWVKLTPDEDWEPQLHTLLGALNFLSCRNVGIAEPQLSRPERRQMARIGVDVHTIQVYPPGTSTRSASRIGPPTGGQPISPVRGHFSHYGPEYGKGLLFGKLAGKFWIHGHARGQTPAGESDYELRP